MRITNLIGLLQEEVENNVQCKDHFNAIDEPEPCVIHARVIHYDELWIIEYTDNTAKLL